MKKSRRPRLTRVTGEALLPLRLTPRDAEIIRTVYNWRAMTSRHIESLFFTPSARSLCIHRLGLLYHHGYLDRAEQVGTISEGSKPLVYFLDTKGAELVARIEGCKVAELLWRRYDNDVRWLFLEHLLALNDVRLAITLSARKHGYQLVTWRTEGELKLLHQADKVEVRNAEGNVQKRAVFPDSYLLLQGERFRYHNFIEVDRATETGQATRGGRDWARKIAAYNSYFAPQSLDTPSLYERRYGTPRGRVLTVTTGNKRLANLKRITEETGGKARFWFTTMEHIHRSDVLTDPIWQQASKDGLFALVW